MQGFVLKRCLTIAPTKGRAKKQRRDNNNTVQDKISQLPDEVLVSIVCRLTMKEAAKTSILSSRWCKVWTFIQTLYFDHSEILPSFHTRCWKDNDPTLIKARSRYVEWVNRVLRSYQGSTLPLHEFQVRFDLDENYTSHIDTWVKFAIEKKVEYLTMDFASCWHGCRTKNVYHFPKLCDLSDDMGFLNCVSFRKLNLECVNISQDVIQHFISFCPNLEELAITHSHSPYLVDLNIVGQSLCLKHLKIVFCSNLKTLRLFALNLSSFKYVGKTIDISYANVPKLVNLSVGGPYFKYFFCNFPPLSNYLVRLETLILKVLHLEPNMILAECPKLPYLKTLTLDVALSDDESLLVFTSLINAAPSLSKVVLKLFWTPSLSRNRRKSEIHARYPHPCLKEVQIDGFVGRTMDMEFAEYLLEIAIVLEKVSLDVLASREPSLKLKKRAMKKAMLLNYKFCLGDKLVMQNF